MKRLLGGDLPKEETFDIRVTRYLTRSHSKKKCLYPESADQYRYICQKVAFDYFPADGYGEYEISLRVIRFPIGNSTYENIMKRTISRMIGKGSIAHNERKFSTKQSFKLGIKTIPGA